MTDSLLIADLRSANAEHLDALAKDPWIDDSLEFDQSRQICMLAFIQ